VRSSGSSKPSWNDNTARFGGTRRTDRRFWVLARKRSVCC
jgi:hypothetical protein